MALVEGYKTVYLYHLDSYAVTACNGYLVSSHVVTVQLPTRCLVDRFLRHENFQEKAGIPAFLVKIYAFSFLFMMFWAFLTRFLAFLLKVILMPVLQRPHGT